MSNAECIKPPGDKVRKAIKWLGQAVQSHPEKTRRQLLEEAEIRFNLSPRECEFLDANFGDTPKA